MAGWPEKDEMKLKTVEVDGKQYAEVQDGKPVYVEDDGKEIAFDAVGTRATITRLNGEAKQHRERAEKAEKIARTSKASRTRPQRAKPWKPSPISTRRSWWMPARSRR